MTPWRILLTDGLDENGQALLRQAATVDDQCGVSPYELLKIIKDYDALIVQNRTRLTAGVFEAAQRLKGVGGASVSIDNIDLPGAHQHGVTGVNAPASPPLAAPPPSAAPKPLRSRTPRVKDETTWTRPPKPLLEPKQRTGGRRNAG